MAANPFALGPPSINANILGSLATPLAGDAVFRRREFLEYTRLLTQTSRRIIDEISSSGASDQAAGHLSPSLERTPVAATARRLAAQVSKDDARRRTIPASSPETVLHTYTPPASSYASYAADEAARQPAGVGYNPNFEDELQTRLPPTHKYSSLAEPRSAEPKLAEPKSLTPSLTATRHNSGHLDQSPTGFTGNQGGLRPQEAPQERAFYEAAAQRRNNELDRILALRREVREAVGSENRIEKKQLLDEQAENAQALRSRRSGVIEEIDILRQEENRYQREIALLIEDRIARIRADANTSADRFSNIQAEKNETEQSRRRDQANRDQDRQQRIEDTQQRINDLAYREASRIRAKREARIEASEAFTARKIEAIQEHAALQQNEDRYQRIIAQQTEDRIARNRTDTTIAADRLADIRAGEKEAAQSLRRDRTNRDQDHRRRIEETQQHIDDLAYREVADFLEERNTRIEASQALRDQHIEAAKAVQTDHHEASQNPPPVPQYKQEQNRQEERFQEKESREEPAVEDTPNTLARNREATYTHQENREQKHIPDNQNERQASEEEEIGRTIQDRSLSEDIPNTLARNRQAAYTYQENREQKHIPDNQNERQASEEEKIRRTRRTRTIRDPALFKADQLPPIGERKATDTNPDNTDNNPIDRAQSVEERSGLSVRASPGLQDDIDFEGHQAGTERVTGPGYTQYQPEPNTSEKQTQYPEGMALSAYRQAQREAAEIYTARSGADSLLNQPAEEQTDEQSRYPDHRINRDLESERFDNPERDPEDRDPAQRVAASSPSRLEIEV